MRIFQITESLEVGGAERVVVTLANALAMRHDVSVICTKRGGLLEESLQPGIGVRALGKREGLDAAAVGRLVTLFRRERPDVVHTHDWGVFLDAMLACRLAGVRTCVHTVHGLYMAGGTGRAARIKRSARHALERWFARGSRVVCVSEELRSHVAAEVRIGPELTRAIPNGIAVDEQPPAAPPSGTGGVSFIAVSRLAAVKNLPLMIRAFAGVSRRIGGVTLTVVGDGPERPSLERLAESLGLGERIRFLGFRGDTDDLLRSADVLLLSSLSEGIPMSVLEAMKNARPVIATRVGGVESLVQNGATGLLVASEDEDAFAAAMTQMAGDAEGRRRMGLAGHARVRALYGVERMVAAYLELYRSGAR